MTCFASVKTFIVNVATSLAGVLDNTLLIFAAVTVCVIANKRDPMCRVLTL
jgi:hypothetical protein